MIVSLILLTLLAGSLVYSTLAIVAAFRYLMVQRRELKRMEPVSVLKPLHGLDLGLESNLRTFFEQAYADFEILFAVREPHDAAVPIVERLQNEYPQVPSRLIVTGEPPYPNAKVYSLDKMMAAAANDLLVMSDSDIRVTADMLRSVAAEFQDPTVGVATCPYRAVAGPSFWSRLEAIGMNTDFLSGILVARMLEGMQFAVGPTIVARKKVLEAIGGFNRFKEYLAEDFVMGNRAAELGHGVILSSYVIEHRIGSQGFVANCKHRLRWNRSTRRSRPWGYVGQVFTNPLPLALLLWAAAPQWWPVLAATAVLRAAAGVATAGVALRDPLTARLWWLVPLQDVASFVCWAAGFFGNTIVWRGRKYYLRRDGRFELLA